MTASALDIAPLEPWPACRGFGCGAWPTTLRSPLPTSSPGGALMFGQFAKEWPQSAGFRPRIRSGKNVPNGETGEGELTRRKRSFSLGTLDAKLGPVSGAWSGGTRRAHVGGRTRRRDRLRCSHPGVRLFQYDKAYRRFNAGEASEGMLLALQLAARDVESTVILGDPTVAMQGLS